MPNLPRCRLPALRTRFRAAVFERAGAIGISLCNANPRPAILLRAARMTARVAQSRDAIEDAHSQVVAVTSLPNRRVPRKEATQRRLREWRCVQQWRRRGGVGRDVPPNAFRCAGCAQRGDVHEGALVEQLANLLRRCAGVEWHGTCAHGTVHVSDGRTAELTPPGPSFGGLGVVQGGVGAEKASGTCPPERRRRFSR